VTLRVPVGVGVGSDCAQYLPPVIGKLLLTSSSTQTIISLPVQTAVIVSGARRAVDAGGRPTVDKGVVSASSVKEGETVVPAPDDHFTVGPHCRVSASGARRVGSARRCPTVGVGIISPTGAIIDETISSAPDYHFAAGPHCR